MSVLLLDTASAAQASGVAASAFIALGLLSLAVLFGAVEFVLRCRKDEEVPRPQPRHRRIEDEDALRDASPTPPPEAPSQQQQSGRHPLMAYHEFSGNLGADGSATVGSPSAHPIGVLYQGPWEHPADGFNEHVRRAARALSRTGVPVHLRALRPVIATTAKGSEEEGIEASVADLLHASIGRYAVTVQQVVANPGLLDRITTPSRLAAQVYTDEQLAAQYAYRVLYTVYERAPIPPDDARAFGRVGQVWVACQRDAKSLREAGVAESKIRVIPACFMPDDPLLAFRSRRRQAGVPRFYHIGKWEPRKAADRVIGAFLRAFKPGEAELVVKTGLPRLSYDGFPGNPNAAVGARLHDPKVVANGWTSSNWGEWLRFETRRMPLAEIHKIHAWGDVYVSLSRGEGFDLPGLDAKLAGNLLVYTPSGGPQDYATDVDLRVEPTGTVACNAVYGWEPEARYLDYDIDDAVKALRAAAAEVTLSRKRDEPPLWSGPIESTNLVEFSAERVGQKIRAALQDVVGPEGKLVEP